MSLDLSVLKMCTPLKIRFLIILFTVFIFGFCQFSDGEEKLEVMRVGGIKDVIEQYIEKLRTSIPEPITVTNYSLELSENDFITGHLDVSDVKLSGIKGFNISLKYILALPKSFVISFDYIDLNLKYVSDLQLLNQPLLSIFGDGHALMALSNLTITGKIDLSIANLNLTITSMGLSLSAAKFLFIGLLNDDDLSTSVTEYLNNNFARLFNENSDVISETARNAVNDLISGILNGNSTIGIKYEHDADDYDWDETDYNIEVVDTFLQKIVECIASTLN